MEKGYKEIDKDKKILENVLKCIKCFKSSRERCVEK